MSSIIRRQGLIIIHIVLALLTLSACASSTPAATETPEAAAPSAQETPAGASASLRPINSDECVALRTVLEQRLAAPILQANAPFSDSIQSLSGTACQLTAKGTGKEFGSFVEVADKIRALLTEQGWTEDHAYMADGPTGTAAGFRKGSALALMSVEWQPGPEVQCPADQPISACEVAPQQQIFDISLSLAQ